MRATGKELRREREKRKKELVDRLRCNEEWENERERANKETAELEGEQLGGNVHVREEET